MTYAKNSLGSSTGRRFNMSAIKRELDGKRDKTFDAQAFEAHRQKRDARPKTINFGTK
jgi:hypothetical protein